MSAVVHVRLTPKKPPRPEPNGPPPSYEVALQLPSAPSCCSTVDPQEARIDEGTESSSITPPRSRRQSLTEQQRRLSIAEVDNENEETAVATKDNGLADDECESYSTDDETFESYEDEHTTQAAEAPEGKYTSSALCTYQTRGARRDEAGATVEALRSRRSSLKDTRSPLTFSQDQPPIQYDEQTYSVVSKLRTLNRQLSTKLEQQTKQIQNLQDENKQQLAKIQTLERDLLMVRQTLKNVQAVGTDRVVTHRSQEKGKHDSSPPLYESLLAQGDFSRVELPQFSQPLSVRSPRQLATTSIGTQPATTPYTKSRPKSEGSPRSALAVFTTARRSVHTAPNTSTHENDKISAARIEKLEQEKRDLINRHTHQLANYSHELSRLERQVENAQKLVQAKDYQLRLQKSRHLYSCCGGSSGSGSGANTSDGGQRHHHHSTLLSDQLWRDLMPSTPPASTLLALPFTSHVGQAFEQLLGHQLMSFHDRMVDTTTRDWLHEIRRCGFQVLSLHHSFQCMSQTFKTLAACCHIYELAEAFTREVQQLTKAEQAFLFVMDPAENEFWCRVPRPGDTSSSKDMITVRSRVMPLAGTGGVSAVAAEHTGTTAQNTALLAAAATPGGMHVPCGLASWVFHTKKPLLIQAGHVTKNPHHSNAPDSTDRLMHFKSASTLLLPILHGSTTLGVIQVCGKLTQVAALGVSISLEKCEAFTLEDQVILTLMSHFLSGVLPKAAYFTEVESNKVNEETLIQLAPEIFTCLRFEELGKIVIQNAKEILDADRCSLFVADNDDRMLYNWQSDISGKGGVEVINDVKKSTMRIPFGHGIVGMVAETRQVINIPDAYEDPRFNSSWDKKTNYRTKSILTVPILSTVSAKSKAPIRRRRSQHDVYGAVIMEKTSDELQKEDEAEQERQTKQQLLGVVQVINKSGGAPFRSKDEFLLQTISKLIALAIENSQLFQKTQELCASLGKLIADADLAEAVSTLSACAEDIIGVESAAIYVLSSDHGSQELVTYHRKRRHKIVVKEQMYRHSLLEKALRSCELVIANEISSSSRQFNAYVDSIGGITARNVLFMPLLVDDPEDPTQTSKKLIGILHLVNTRGRKLKFDRFDLFLSIVGSQTCSVLASILEKQALLRQQDQTKHLLDTTLSFFKEMSPVGIINAVYNTCSSLFRVEKAHLFLWEPDHRAMWTAKLSPNAESVSAAMASSSTELAASTSSITATSSSSSGAAVGHAPPLRSQARRISVLTDQKIRVPATEGLLEHVLSKSGLVVVKQWVDVIDETNSEGDGNSVTIASGGLETPPVELSRGIGSTSQQSIEVSKYVLRACRSDHRAGFTKHSVVACPVWDIYGQEVVGVVVLLFAKGKAPSPSELGNLPNLSRQISGALNVCDDLRAVTQRCQKLQRIAEVYTPRRSPPAMSFTLSARGQLVAFSQPLNVCSPSFSVSTMLQYGHAMAKTSGTANSSSFATLDLSKLPLDEEGHRWVFALSGTSLQEMTGEHYVNWIGKDVASASGMFDKLRTDLQSVYVRKETVQGVLTLQAPGSPTKPIETSATMGLPKAVVLQLRLLLWEFADEQLWRVDIKRACKIFDCVDPSRTRHVSRQHVEFALTTNGRKLELDQVEWDLVHAAFADPDTDLVDVERMLRLLAPAFKPWPRIAYELTPILDTITQSVVSVHVFLTAISDNH